MARLTSSGAAVLHETGKTTFPSFSGGVPRGVSFSPCPHAPEAPAPSMIANVNAPTVLFLVTIASLGRFPAAPNGDSILYLIPLSARVRCPLGAGQPSPESPRITFRRAADVAVFERPLGPQDDHGRLSAVGRQRGDVVVFPVDMDDPEVDLRLHPSGPPRGSQPARVCDRIDLKGASHCP